MDYTPKKNSYKLDYVTRDEIILKIISQPEESRGNYDFHYTDDKGDIYRVDSTYYKPSSNSYCRRLMLKNDQNYDYEGINWNYYRREGNAEGMAKALMEAQKDMQKKY